MVFLPQGEEDNPKSSSNYPLICKLGLEMSCDVKSNAVEKAAGGANQQVEHGRSGSRIWISQHLLCGRRQGGATETEADTIQEAGRHFLVERKRKDDSGDLSTDGDWLTTRGERRTTAC